MTIDLLDLLDLSPSLGTYVGCLPFDSMLLLPLDFGGSLGHLTTFLKKSFYKKMHRQSLHHTCSSAMRPPAHRSACMFDSCSAYRLIQHSDLMLVFSLALYMRSLRERITLHILMITICGVLCPAFLNSSCLSECWLTH
jgi:hypothetical protein